MDSIDRRVIYYNYNFKKNKKLTYAKFEDRCSSDDSVSSDNILEEKTFGNTHKNQNMLPLKKRFGISPSDLSLNLRTRPSEHTNPWIQMQKDYKARLY